MQGTMRRLWVGLILCAIVGANHPARAADEGADGRIVIFADMSNKLDSSERGYYLVHPKTGVWTQATHHKVKNGPIEGAQFRLAPSGREVAYGLFETVKSPKGESYADARSIWIRPLRMDGTPRKISDLHGEPMWSPDGARLIVAGVTSEFGATPVRHAAWRIESDGSGQVRLPIPETDWVQDWSPDGRWLAAIAVDPKTRSCALIVQHPDGTGRKTLAIPKEHFVELPRFSPDGRSVAYLTAYRGGKEVWIADMDGGPARKVRGIVEDIVFQSVTWSPDGRELAGVFRTWTRSREGGKVLGDDDRLALIDVADGRVWPFPHAPARLLLRPEWHRKAP